MAITGETDHPININLANPKNVVEIIYLEWHHSKLESVDQAFPGSCSQKYSKQQFSKCYKLKGSDIHFSIFACSKKISRNMS